MSIVAIAALVVGVAIGVMAVYLHDRRQQARAQRRTKTHSGLSELEALQRIFVESPFGMVLVDRMQDVVMLNNQARLLGLVGERHLASELWPSVENVFDSQEPVTFSVRPSSFSRVAKPVESLTVNMTPLERNDTQFVVVYGIDATEEARLEKTRRDFVANVSHELKTPVGAISLLAEALLTDTSDPELVEHFTNQLHSESIRLSQLVNELMALSRLQGAEKLPDPQLVSVDDVVDQVLSRSLPASEKMDVAVTTDDPCGWTVWGDQTLLVTALHNLVMNAINYSPADTTVVVSRKRMTVDTLRRRMAVPNAFLATSHSLRDSQELVVIQVTDRGTGIPVKYINRVFERFFRVDKARSRNSGGTGLGLAIVKQIALNSGGAVALWSKPGVGSTFTLGFLPDESPTSSQVLES